MPGLSGFQVRERSVPRSHRCAVTAEVDAPDQGGHDGLGEELVTGKPTVGQASRDNTFKAIDPVILGEAILGLPGEAREPAALILDAAANEPTVDRAARKIDTGEESDTSWAEEVTSAIQIGFSVAAIDVGEGVRIHEPADAAADSPLRVDPFLRGSPADCTENSGGTGASTPHVGPIAISQDADHELTRAKEPAPRAEPELRVAAAAAAGQPAPPAVVGICGYSSR